MGYNQVNSNSTNVSHSAKIRTAIDLLLSSDSVGVTEPTVKLTECSPKVEVIMNKEGGGICTKCNTMFKSKPCLTSHLEKCGSLDSLNSPNDSDSPSNDSNSPKSSENSDSPNTNSDLNNDHIDASDNIIIFQPRLIIVPQ